jgi:hypothetical protein
MAIVLLLGGRVVLVGTIVALMLALAFWLARALER